MPSPYEIPAFGGSGDSLLGWLLEAVSEANGWLMTQRPSRSWESVVSLIAGDDNGPVIAGQSNVGYNRVTRNARDIVASLSNFRHEGEFRPTFDKRLYDRAHLLTKLDRYWAKNCHAYDTYRANLQNAVAFGTGYLVTDWDKHAHGSYGDIRMRAFAPNDVTFVQLPRDHDIQKAYMVLIREELPLNLAKATYKNIAGHLTADRDAPGWIQKGLQKLQTLMGGSPALAVAGTMGRTQQGSFPTVDIWHAYIRDGSINESGFPVKMGTHGTNWSYTVPALGDPIPTNMRNPATGQMFTRPAEDEDCQLFPLRRYCIFSRTAVAYDGSSPWWHGDVPVARLRFNDWAWEALGKSLLSEAKPMQDGIIALMRYIEDTCAVQLDPALLYDDTLVSEGFAKSYNPRMAGSRAAVALNTGSDVIKFPVPPGTYRVDAAIMQWVQEQEGRIDHGMGTPDLVAMAKAKQVPGEGTLEKLMEMAGPLVDDMVRAQEVPLEQGGNWRKSLYFQFYSRNRMIKVTGPDLIAMTGDDDNMMFEYSPDDLIGRMEGESPDSRQQRAKGLISEFSYHVEESSINERHRMANKLALLQLKKAGVKISDFAIARAWQIHDYGPAPEGTKNVVEEWVAEQHMNAELAGEVQQQLGEGQVGGAPPQQGRPPSLTAEPRLVSKDGGARSTVTTT